MLTATKIRIYPNTLQAEKLAKAFGSARWFWNNSLAENQRLYDETGKGLDQVSMNARLPTLKAEFPWLEETYSQVYQSVSLNIKKAFTGFFDKRSKYPKFKSKYDSRQSIQYPQSVRIVDDGRKLLVPKIGHLKAKIHRDIEGEIKTVTISFESNGHYYASILTDNEIADPAISFEGKILGINVGLTHLAVTSDGVKFDNPKHIKRAENNLKRKQQSLARKVKGSNTWLKAKLLLAKSHAHVKHARKDYLHQLSRQLVDENQVIAVEDLHVKGMMKNHNLAKSISDVGWGMLSGFLKYKAAKAGKGYIEVGRFFASSKTCSDCLIIQKNMPLNIRVWTCQHCNAVHDRDINAAINIKQEAQRLIAAGAAATANGDAIRQSKRRKSSVMLASLKLEALTLMSA